MEGRNGGKEEWRNGGKEERRQEEENGIVKN
jgi:hypothetical protein